MAMHPQGAGDIEPAYDVFANQRGGLLNAAVSP
jgi:hypothetical protein